MELSGYVALSHLDGKKQNKTNHSKLLLEFKLHQPSPPINRTLYEQNIRRILKKNEFSFQSIYFFYTYILCVVFGHALPQQRTTRAVFIFYLVGPKGWFVKRGGKNPYLLNPLTGPFPEALIGHVT